MIGLPELMQYGTLLCGVLVVLLVVSIVLLIRRR